VPFFPYAPYQPQTELSVAGGQFSRHHSEQLSTVNEDVQEDEEEHNLEDNERVCIFCASCKNCQFSKDKEALLLESAS